MMIRNETEIMMSWTDTESPLLSVLCITYNHENYITEALDSILMQETDFPFEVIVHDDFSTDKTADILVKYAEKYPTIIKLILQKENQWSKGIKPVKASLEKASGKYIAFCEGDDYWTDTKKLQIQLDEMRKIENCQMSFHPSIDKWDDNSIKDEINTKYADGNKVFSVKEIILGDGGFCPTVSLMFEKEAISNMPEWFERAPFGDYFLQIFGALKGGALYIDRAMAVYRRMVPGSWSAGVLEVKTREKQVQKAVLTMDEMDSYFDKQFHSEISQIKSNWYFTLARAYFRNNDFENFNQTISKSYHISERKSKKLLLNFYLRQFPILLQGMGKIKKYLNIKG